MEKLDDSGVTIRAIVKTPPLKQADVTREWKRRIKDEFDRAGIEFATKGVVTLEAGHELRETGLAHAGPMGTPAATQVRFGG